MGNVNAISPERWALLLPLLDRALDSEGDARRVYVDSLPDAGLRAELIQLLAQHESMGPKSMPNAMDLATPLVEGALEEEAALDHARVGQMIGPYELVQLLGAGGMGAVYLAERSTQGFAQQVALKLVRKSLGSATARERFEGERRILARLKHAGIAQLFDGGQTEDGQSYYTMEFVEGEPVTDYCTRECPSIAERIRVLLQITAALAYSHQNI